MNQQQYRNAVQQIRWSPQKRAEVEELLRQKTSASAMEISAPQKARSRTKIHHNKHRVTEGELMASKHFRRIMWIGLAASVLSTGGVIAGIAAYAKMHPHIRNITWENGISLNLTDQISMDVFHDWTTNPDSVITPTENGWFYRRTIEFPSDEYDWFPSNNINALFYTDRETGKSVPVCARPNCVHDGSEYCTASTKTYANSFMTYYDGSLYTVTTKYLHPEKRHTQFQADDGDPLMTVDECRQVLLRYSADGTEITELAQFGNGIGTGWCTVHRGYVWCIVQRQEQGEEIENPITHSTSSFKSGGWQLWGYELSTGRSAVIFDGMGKPDTNHVNKAPDALYGIGDYLYFYRTHDDWSGPQGLCRISLVTGEVTDSEEEVVIPGNHFVALSHSHAISVKDRKENNATYQDYMLIDLKTGEQKLLLSAEVYGDDPKKAERFYHIVTMDDRYIYAFNTWNSVPEEGVPRSIMILDYDGNPVRQIDTDYICRSYVESRKTKDKSYKSYTEYESLFYSEYFTPDYTDGVNLYASYVIYGDQELLEKEGKTAQNAEYYCPIESLLNDDHPEWKRAFTYEEATDDAN
ncbi:MAG: hypothetical protein MJ065_09115 [Oscillospiraceae bacterium]|nr:hypothetical protein [Oscillospiraceae bacterium]